MPQARDEAGNIWEVDEQGNVLRLIQPAQAAAQPNMVQTRGADPARPFEVRSKEAQADIASATAPYAGPKAAADAQAAELKVREAEQELGSAPDPARARAQQELQNDNVLQAINDARRLVGEGWSTGNFFGGGTWSGVPAVGQNAKNLEGALNTIKGNLSFDRLQQMREASKTGGALGSVSNIELQLLGSTVASIDQGQDAETILNNLARVERHYRSARALLNNEDPRDPVIAEKYGILNSAPSATGSDIPPPGGGELTSQGRFNRDPTLAGVNAKVGSMIRAGRSAEEIRAYLENIRPGMGAQVRNIEAAINYANQNPGTTPDIDIEKVWVPASGLSQTLGNIGMSPVGAGLIGAADILSMGTLDNFTDNPDATRATMAGVSDANPNSYLLGQVGGGILGSMVSEAGLAARGITGFAGNRAADLGLGAAYGAGSADDPEDSRIAGLLIGGGAGLGGGMAGRSAARASGRAISGVTDEVRRQLADAGIRMTPGQLLGGAVQRTEDRLAGLPLVGDQIRARRTEGLEDFNRVAMEQAVAAIDAPGPPQIGQAGVNANQQAISDAYSRALTGRQFQADPQFEQDIAAALTAGRAIPQLGDQFDTAMTSRVGTLFDEGGNISGEGFQDAIQGVRKATAATNNEVLGPEFAQSAGMVEDGLRGLVSRQAPDVLPAFDAANTAYRHQSVIDDAVLKALNQGGTFTPAQLGQAARSNTIKYGGKRAAARGDMPFNDLQQAGHEVLPSQIPDSGTAGRLVIPGLVGALAGGGGYASRDGDVPERIGSGAGTAAIAASLAAAPYSPAVRSAIQRALIAQRPELMEVFGRNLIENSAVAGRIAAPYADVKIAGGR
jgi:hypothetical protein